MALQISSERSNSNRVVDLRSMEALSVDRQRRNLAESADRYPPDEVVLSLVHLNVALAMNAGGPTADTEVPYFKVCAKGLEPDDESELQIDLETREDPVIQRLNTALAAAEAAHDSHSAICADALRLAILTRQFARQTQLRAGTPVQADRGAGRGARSLQKWRLKRVLDYVERNLAEKIGLQDLATVAGLSRMHFAAQFRAATGIRPREYLLKRRIKYAEELLKQSEISLVDVALSVGFQTQAHFTTVFKRYVGDTPFQWRSAYLAERAEPTCARSLS